MKSIQDVSIHNQLVFLRVDFNVPLDKKQNITEDARIKAALPTIQFILEKGGRLVIASHLGRPKGGFDARLGMRPVAKRLEELLGKPVQLAPDCIGQEVEKMKAALKSGEVLLLENLRFYAQEEENDLHFAESLAEQVDVYVTDAFGALHRKHASTFSLPTLIFDKAAGFLIEKEVAALNKIINEPEQPFVVLIGGVKISDKVDVIHALAPKSDVVLVGGGVASTFLKSQGVEIGTSVIEAGTIDVARDIWQRCELTKPSISVKTAAGEPVHIQKIVLPVDAIIAQSTDEGAETRVVDFSQGAIPADWMILDIGPKTQTLFTDIIAKAKTVFWNGPMGLFEQDAYAKGSRAVATAIAQADGYAVVGGGDTESVIQKAELAAEFDHVSTGGGASLEYIAYGTLPGLQALE